MNQNRKFSFTNMKMIKLCEQFLFGILNLAEKENKKIKKN